MIVELRTLGVSLKVVPHPVVDFIRHVEHQQFVKEGSMFDRVKCFALIQRYDTNVGVGRQHVANGIE